MDLSKYYEEICRAPLLAEGEEEDLFLELRDPGISEELRNQIKDRIIKSHLRFVFKQAKYFSKNEPDLFEELIGAGNEGLLVGLEKFDPQMGMKFLTYAGYWVKQRILNQMSKLRIVSLPIWKQQLAAKIKRFCESRETTSLDDLRDNFPDVKEKDLIDLWENQYLTYYIEDLGDESAFEVNPIEADVEARLDRDRLHTLIEQLPELHKEVICLSYGIRDGIDRKAVDVATELGLTKEKLKELKKEALTILKEKMGPESPFE